MALILTRKPGESFHIGDDIVVKITEIYGRNVRLAIEAPRKIRVLREELVPAKESES